MGYRLLIAGLLGLALCAASAQDVPATPPTAPAPATAPAQPHGGGGGQGQGQRGGHDGRGGGGPWSLSGGGGGIMGTVTEAAADHYTVKSDAGETYLVHFSVNTQILKQAAAHRGDGGEHRSEGGEGGGNPPQAIKPSEIKVGDAIGVMGEVDAGAKSIGATHILQFDPERARQLREQEANYGKTWLMGKVTAIDGVKVTLLGRMDNAAHAFVADENTTFRKRRDPITLGDIAVGDLVRVEGAVKGGVFLAASVSVMGMGPGGTPAVPRDAAPAAQSK